MFDLGHSRKPILSLNLDLGIFLKYILCMIAYHILNSVVHNSQRLEIKMVISYVNNINKRSKFISFLKSIYISFSSSKGASYDSKINSQISDKSKNFINEALYVINILKNI